MLVLSKAILLFWLAVLVLSKPMMLFEADGVVGLVVV